MNRTLATLCLAALAIAPAACLGDDPNHIDGATGVTGLHPDGKPDPTLRTYVLGSVLHPPPATVLQAPELCGDCRVMLVKQSLGDLVAVVVNDADTGAELCHLTVSASGLGRTIDDTCGLSTAE